MVISLKKRKKKNLIFIHSLAQRTNQRELIFIHSLAQRTNQETSTLTKASPYMERMQHRKSQKPSIFFRFSIAGHAMSF